MSNIRGPVQSAASDAGSRPKKQREVSPDVSREFELLDIYRRLRPAAVHHFKINESSVRSTVRKEWPLNGHCSDASRHGNLALFAKELFILCWKCSFCVGTGLLYEMHTYRLQCDSRKCKAIIWQLKTREGEGVKVGKFNASKGYFDRFKMVFGF